MAYSTFFFKKNETSTELPPLKTPECIIMVLIISKIFSETRVVKVN